MKSFISAGRRSSIRAFTMAETLVATTVFTMLMSMAFGFYYYAYNIYTYDLGRTFVNRDFRRFETDMNNVVPYCNSVLVYNEFTDRTVYTDSNGNFSGNFVLCVFVTLQNDGSNHITRLVGFYRGTQGDQNPIRTFTVNTDVVATTDPLTLIPAAGTVDTHAIRYPDCVGLNPGGKVFRNFVNAGTGVMVYAQIQNKADGLARKKTAANAFHFTVVRRS